jgi:hypothetical protein
VKAWIESGWTASQLNSGRGKRFELVSERNEADVVVTLARGTGADVLVPVAE